MKRRRESRKRREKRRRWGRRIEAVDGTTRREHNSRAGVSRRCEWAAPATFHIRKVVVGGK
jgi:hypothetical protein